MWNTPFKVRLHEPIEEHNANDPMDDDADEVEQAMSPKVLHEFSLDSLWLHAQKPYSAGNESKPTIIEQEQPSLDSKGVRVNVEQPLCDQLWSWLIPRLYKEPACPKPEVRPWHCTDNSGNAQTAQQTFRESF